MRAKEFIIEANVIGSTSVGEYHIDIDSHFRDRMIFRKVREVDAYSALNKINNAKAKIKTLAPGQSFWLYDNTNNVSLGIKMTDFDKKIYLLKTALPGKPQSDRNYPIFDVA